MDQQGLMSESGGMNLYGFLENNFHLFTVALEKNYCFGDKIRKNIHVEPFFNSSSMEKSVGVLDSGSSGSNPVNIRPLSVTPNNPL